MAMVWKRPQPGEGGAPPPPAEPAPLAEPRTAVAVFVLGLLGVLFPCLPLGAIAWILGHSARESVRAGRAAPSGLLTAGWVMGIVGTVIFIVLLVGYGCAKIFTTGST